jgi:serine/threonine-protein kinase
MESYASIDVRPTEPQVIGRYALFDELAAGGMATVHLGRFVGHVGFSRIVAIKRLHPQFAKDPDFVAMFLDEARLASRIQHPNVVSTLDVVKVASEAFLVMEYVQGASLSRLLRSSIERGELPPQDIVCSVVSGMLHGLHAAHEAKSEKREPLAIVHRDVSPQNVIVGVDGVARVLDFGIAKAAMRSQSTRDGQMKGKLSYMSPEQLNGQDVDRRTDVFAAGIVLWEALAGRKLFEGNDAGQILSKVLTLPIPSPKQFAPNVSLALVKIVTKALERDPSKRFQTARDFAIAIEDAVVFPRPRAIGEWVDRLAHPDLERRAELVARVESWSAEAKSDVEFVTVMESSEGTDESTGLRARQSPPPRPLGSEATRSERVATSPSQVSARGVRPRVATSPSQVSQRMPPLPLPASVPATIEAPTEPPPAPLPPLVGSPGIPRSRVGTSPSLVAQRAAMLGGSGSVRDRVATSPSELLRRSALGAPPLPPPRERVPTSPSEVLRRSAVGAPPPPMPPGATRIGPPPPPAQTGRIVMPVLPAPPGTAAEAEPEFRKKRPVPLWAIGIALVVAAAGGAALATRSNDGERVTQPSLQTPAETKETPKVAPIPAPEPVATTPPAPAVPVVKPTDLPLDTPSPTPVEPAAHVEAPEGTTPEHATATTPHKAAPPARHAAASSCNPPYVIDDKGIKRLKPNCI